MSNQSGADSRLAFKVRGMDCAEEVAALRRALTPLVGTEDILSFDVLNAKLTVMPPASTKVSPKDVIAAVAGAGMQAELWREQASSADARGYWARHGRLTMTVASGGLGATGLAIHAVLAGGVTRALGSEGLGLAAGVPRYAALAYSAGIAAGVWYVLPKALYALRSLRPDMNLLMTIAVAGAIGIDEWFEAATVAFLFALSLTLEAWSVDRARRAVQALLEVAPDTARVREADGSEAERPLDGVAVGSTTIVRPGERIPLDGHVLAGSSAVNQAPITGESALVSKRPGDPVFAGSINGDGLLEIETTKPASDTTLARIIRLVAEAQGQRAPAEQWVERFARYYTPAILVLALLILIVPPVLLGAPWEPWIYRSLVLLVIGCPCALVISTPVSLVAALTSSARAGVLVKGGGHLEAAASLEAIALDKTGTLTHGRPAVVEVIPLGGHDERGLLERVAALEAGSDHPLARAIMSHVRDRGIEFRPARDLQAVQGKGVTATLDGKLYWLGSHRYLEEWGQETAEIHDRLEAMAKAGRSVVIVGDGTHVCGLIALADEIRPQARETVEELRRSGVRHVIMLTGDNAGTAAAVARETGIDEVRSELLPEDKVTAIEALVRDYGRVAMVGDGVNDAPALARATLGIAMGAVGSDAAIETADVALMSDDLAKLPWLIRHARRTLKIIRQNIALSLLVKAAFVILTFAGKASLWSAIAADMGASLLVIANGLRLLKGQEPRRGRH